MKTQAHIAAPPALQRMPVTAAPKGLLQRKCACGGSAGLTGACGGCVSKRLLPGSVNAEGERRAFTSAADAGAHARAGEPYAARVGHSLARLNIHAPAARPFALREEKLDWQSDSFDEGGAAGPSNAQPTQSGAVLPGVQTGGTNCDASKGSPVTNVTNNDPCTKDCSEQHEAKHAADIGPCCAKAGAAYKAAGTDEQKTAVQDKFDKWMLDNVNFLECRGYGVSVKCAEKKFKQLKCEESFTGCCKPVAGYLRSARMQETGTCNNAGKKLTDCPF